MLSPIAKEFLPKYYEGYKKEDIVVVSVMPCTAKKYEATREQLAGETDLVLTTQEFARMIKTAGIDFKKLKDEEANSPFGKYSGAATIFGASGGVAEAAVRSAYYLVTGEELTNVDFMEMRGVDAQSRTKDAVVDIKGTKVKVRVVSTLKEAEKSIQELKAGKADFHILEVMACPGGCVNGGGQPTSCLDAKIKEKRAEGLYSEDKNLELRKSHKNPDVQELYAKHLEKPNSHKAHELLHTTYSNKRKDCYISVGE
jgi:iron only hydrogenase large subunit-like protein